MTNAITRLGRWQHAGENRSWRIGPTEYRPGMVEVQVESGQNAAEQYITQAEIALADGDILDVSAKVLTRLMEDAERK